MEFFFKHIGLRVNKSMTIQNHKHIQITYITLTLIPAVSAYNVSGWLCMAESMVFFSPSEDVNKLAGQELWSWLLIIPKPWLGTWLSEVHYVFNTLLLHGYMQLEKHLIIKLEKYPLTVRKIKKRKETIKADYTRLWFGFQCTLYGKIFPLCL